mmetsp:Transcript_4639/g.3154  ORF Transcript_4639/g.3154 Transcript_4639/m.3154 type:complete len:201 (+) Transcript_4639:583-1185(+)
MIEDDVMEKFAEDVGNIILWRYCFTCESLKPPRSHHCSICDACVLKMDHHCPWVGNCVGFKNHKFFWNFLFHAWMGCLIVITDMGYYTYSKSMLFLIKNTRFGSFTMAMSGALTISLITLLALHTYLLLHNNSTVEFGQLVKNNPFSYIKQVAANRTNQTNNRSVQIDVRNRRAVAPSRANRITKTDYRRNWETSFGPNW